MFRETMRYHKARSLTVTVEDEGGLVNLDGKTLRFVAKLSRRDPDPVLFQLTTGSGIVHKTQASDPGEAVITIVPANTASLNPDRVTVLECDVELDTAAGAEIVDSGVLAVLPAVDR